MQTKKRCQVVTENIPQKKPPKTSHNAKTQKQIKSQKHKNISPVPSISLVHDLRFLGTVSLDSLFSASGYDEAPGSSGKQSGPPGLVSVEHRSLVFHFSPISVHFDTCFCFSTSLSAHRFPQQHAASANSRDPSGCWLRLSFSLFVRGFVFRVS